MGNSLAIGSSYCAGFLWLILLLMKPKEKRQLLVDLIELHVRYGYDITPFVGRPLSYFDYNKVKESIKEFKKDHNEET